MAKQKPFDPDTNDSYVTAWVNGQQAIIPRGDMSDEAWETLKTHLELDGKLGEEGDRTQRPPPEQRRKPAQDADHVEVNIHGEKAVIPRGDMSDEEWAQFVYDAKDQGIFSGSLARPTKDTVEGPDGARYDKTGKFVEGARAFVGEPRDVKRTPKDVEVSVGAPEDVQRSDGGGFIGKSLGQAAIQALRAAPEGGTPGPVSDPYTVPVPGSTAADGGTPMPPVVTGPQGQTYPGPTAGAASLSSYADPYQASLTKNREAAIAGGGYVSPWGTPTPGKQYTDETMLRAQTADLTPEQMAANMPPKPAVDPKDVRFADPAAQAAAGAGAPGAGGPLAPPADPTKGFEEEVAKRVAEQKAAVSGLAEVEGHRMQAIGDLQQKEIAHRAEAQRQMADLQLHQRAALEHVEKAYTDTVAELGKVAKIDPNRMWSKMETGNKVLAGIGIMLGGLGAGTFATLGVSHQNEALKILRDAISDDVKAQQDNVQNRREALGQKAAGQQTMYSMLRQRGMDEYEAFRSSEAARIDTVKMQIDQIANQMGTEEAMAKARVAGAALDSEKDKLLLDVKQHRYAGAIEVWKTREHSRAALAAAAMKAAAKGGGTQMKGPQVERLNDLRSAIDQAKEMRAKYQQFSGLWSKVAGGIPGTEANKFNDEQKLAAQTLGVRMEHGKLTDRDREYYLGLIPRAGTVNGIENWNNIVNNLEREYANQVEGFQAAGYNAGGAPAPDDEAVDFE